MVGRAKATRAAGVARCLRRATDATGRFRRAAGAADVHATTSLPSSPLGSSKAFWFLEKDGGFTSVGVVIALTLTLALLFSTAQVYWANSTAGDIQFAADAGALAAENVVAEYYVVVRITDAVVLTMSLFGLVVYGISIVVSCIPGLQGVGAEILNFGANVFEARDKIAREAQGALNKLQKAMPFLAAVNAHSVISANSFSPSGEPRYCGIAILVPLTGDNIEFPSDEASKTSLDTLEKQNAETSTATDAAEAARQEMEKAKLEGYLADCGNNPSYCLYERAGHLANMSGSQNPYFSSAELWQFDYALTRAQDYYKARLQKERATAYSVPRDISQSFAREQFYAYAAEEMLNGYVYSDNEGNFDAYFPLLPSSSNEFYSTPLYTNCVYPYDASSVIHGYSSCPGVSEGVSGYGSISGISNGTYSTCSDCELTVVRVSQISNPTSQEATGFESHYRKVAQAAENYKAAAKDYKEQDDKAKESAGKAFDSYGEALEALKSPRINVKPPGRNGCVVIAFDLSSHDIPRVFTNSILKNKEKLEPRVAISAAVLVEDTASSGHTILSTFLDMLKSDLEDGKQGLSMLGAFDGILTVWGDVLFVYSKGADPLAQAVGDFLRKIPIVKATPLADWAQKTLQETLEAFGLQGVNLSAPKPIVVNSIHVVNAGDAKALDVLGEAKKLYSSIPGAASGTIAEGIVDGLLVEIEKTADEFLESEITIYTISFGTIPGVPQIPIKIKLPEAAVSVGRSLFADGVARLNTLLGGGGNGRLWE